jgi:thiol-disulfide isomerase/thioredoxin
MVNVRMYWNNECPHCRAFKPVFDAWAEKYTGASFLSIPLDDPWEARRLCIRRLPTVVVEDGNTILGWYALRLPTEEEIAALVKTGDNPGKGDTTVEPTGKEGGKNGG